jgi:hypothetical protein
LTRRPRAGSDPEATRLEVEIAQYAEAMGLMGARVPEVVAQLTARQRRLADVRTRLHRLAEGPGARSAEEVVPEIRRRLGDMQELDSKNPPMSGRSSGDLSSGVISCAVNHAKWAVL